MSAYRYLHLDVFTNQQFAGNQLAVFPEAVGLETPVMQRIAAEMAFSETTFVFAAEGDGDVRMRIFTPGAEVPMAGHPTVGSTFALAQEGVIAPSRERFVFELGVGPTPVSLEWTGSALDFAWMRQQEPTFGDPIDDIELLTTALGLQPADVRPDGLPVQDVSCGLPFLLVPLATRRAVDAAVLDHPALARFYRALAIDDLPVFLFSTEAADVAATAYSRMFAPGFGIAEDPATGSASGPLGAYLVRHGVVPRGQTERMLSLQGVKMGRPSEIFISITRSGSGRTEVRVGGRAVMIATGTLTVA